jgi:hypothetical protein
MCGRPEPSTIGNTMSEITSSRSRWRAFQPDTAGAIYGTITATAVIAATVGHATPRQVLGVTVATVLVLWLAHVYAHALAHHLRGATSVQWSAIVRAMGEERPMLVAPLPAFVLLLLGVLGLLDEERSIRLALWAGVLQLIGWGLAFARRQGWGWPAATVAGLVNGVFGLAVVLLEVLLH